MGLIASLEAPSAPPPMPAPRERLELTRRAFRFLHLAHTSQTQDIYCAYIVLALGLSECATAAQKVRPLRPVGVNLLSLSEMTGIPRETVRRKLQLLIDGGLVRQDGDRAYALTDASVLNLFTSPLESRPA